MSIICSLMFAVCCWLVGWLAGWLVAVRGFSFNVCWRLCAVRCMLLVVRWLRFVVRSLMLADCCSSCDNSCLLFVGLCRRCLIRAVRCLLLFAVCWLFVVGCCFAVCCLLCVV